MKTKFIQSFIYLFIQPLDEVSVWSVCGQSGLVWSVVGGVKEGVLRIGSTEVPVYTTENKMKVPDVLFYDNHQVECRMVLWQPPGGV